MAITSSSPASASSSRRATPRRSRSWCRRKQLISANTLFSGGFTIAQIAGLIVLSPLISEYRPGAGAFFIIAAVGIRHRIAAGARCCPLIGTTAKRPTSTFPESQELRGAVRRVPRTRSGSCARDSQSTLAMAHIMTSSTLILLFAILVPKYMQAI